MAYATSDIIDWAKAGQPLAMIGEEKKLYLKRGAIDLGLHMKLYVERKSLEWQYDQDPSDDDGILFGQGNYVYALCGQYIFDAMDAVGGGQVVVPGTNIAGAEREDFIVSSSSYLVTGTSSATLSDFIGRELNFVRGGIAQSTVASEPSYFTWNKSTAAFTCSPALIVGELISIIPS